jgi:hypothetical protein
MLAASEPWRLRLTMHHRIVAGKYSLSKKKPASGLLGTFAPLSICLGRAQYAMRQAARLVAGVAARFADAPAAEWIEPPAD